MIQVSVVIPVYNIEAHLRQCLDSVLGQTLEEIEIICVDDGSTDCSPEILKEYEKKDSRLRVITQTNAGPGAARNTGMNQVTGKYLIFLDSDDWFEPDFLKQMVRRAEETPTDIVICRAVEFDTRTGRELPSEWMLKRHGLPGDVFTPEEAADHLFQFAYGWPWDKLYRMDFIHKSGLCYPALKNSEDLVFVFQSLAAARQIALCDQVLIHHRVNRKSSVSNSRHRDLDEPYRALRLFQQGLVEMGKYQVFQRSFLNWAMEFLIWNAANLPEYEAQRSYYLRLRWEYLTQLQFDRYPASYYYSKNHYMKYLLAKQAPFPVFWGVTALYHRLKQITTWR